MTYADSLLGSGETVILRTRQHPFVLLHALAVFVLTAIIAGVVLVGGGMLADRLEANAVRQITLAVFALVLVFGFVRMTIRWLVWRSEEYLITNHRVMKVEGLISKRSADSSLEKVNDAVLTQGLLGRIFGFGSLDIMTAAESTVDQFRMLRDPKAFKIAMLDAKTAQYASGVTN